MPAVTGVSKFSIKHGWCALTHPYLDEVGDEAVEEDILERVTLDRVGQNAEHSQETDSVFRSRNLKVKKEFDSNGEPSPPGGDTGPG